MQGSLDAGERDTQVESVASPPILELIGLKKTYAGDVQAVREVNLQVQHGEIVTILGPSGCGKTTTLRMVLGLEELTGGRIVFDGVELDAGVANRRVPVHQRNMGMVFQSYAVWPHMSVAENISYPLRIRRPRKRRPSAADIAQAVERVADLVGLSGLVNRPASKLSGGEAQRVALARALVAEPKLLLLDEPFSNLDALLRSEMRTEVKRLQRRLDISVLFVTHDQHEALSMSDKIAVMSRGVVEQFENPERLYEAPRSKMVRDFVGRSNVLTGAITDLAAGGEVRVRLDDEFGGQVVTARLGDHASAHSGDACELSIRPEDLEITPTTGDSVRPANAISCRIGSFLFVGGRYEAVLELPTGRHLDGYVNRQHSFQEGDDVWVGLPADRMLLWTA